MTELPFIFLSPAPSHRPTLPLLHWAPLPFMYDDVSCFKKLLRIKSYYTHMNNGKPNKFGGPFRLAKAKLNSAFITKSPLQWSPSLEQPSDVTSIHLVYMYKRRQINKENTIHCLKL
jgi:hypothetical protein